ncbi:hypothetical protein LWI28_009451 [Acer negundo]|uniref:Uncharacterized protein n=1 Tax=Acer negundo TaxID=4023 RepID=A0AAD5J3X4_ACENE|nr:hypothetical protein LWI28_009451 [Acer negundo]
MVHAAQDDYTSDPDEFIRLLDDAKKPLYPDCTKYTKLSALVKLYNLKARYEFSDQSFSALLKSLSDMLPSNNQLPLSMYEAKKTLNALGMEHEKIHACPNDRILYRKQYQDAIKCPKCNLPRWKIAKNSTEPKVGVAAKVLWYFPPIPRFKRMFQSSGTSKNLIWHANEKEIDGMMCHPSDSPSWKLIDHTWPDFAAEPRNLRLALAADGILCHGRNICKLYCNLHKNKLFDKFAFVDPNHIAYSVGSKEERARLLNKRLGQAKPGQLFLAPYNHIEEEDDDDDEQEGEMKNTKKEPEIEIEIQIIVGFLHFPISNGIGHGLG